MTKSQLPKISIIIPLFNVVPYLRACLDSVTAQTYTNLEIILVDDGSTDGSTETAESYAQQDPRIVYIHQKNSGVSAARNRGLSIATGSLISFVDADDTIAPTLIAYLYDNLARHGADLASTTYKQGANLTKTLAAEPAIKQLLLERNATFHLWGKLYKRELFDDITFPEGHIYEDVATQVQIFSKCSKIFIGRARLYHYRRRPGSYVTTPRASQFADFFRYAEANREFIATNYPELTPYADKYIFTAARRTLQDLLRAKSLTSSSKQTYLARMNSTAKAVLEVPESSSSEKLLAHLSLINSNLPLPLLYLRSQKPPTEDYA